MSDAEFDLLLETVKAAVSSPGEGDRWREAPDLYEPLRAANDNEMAWPLIPFPDGWYAA